VGKILCRLGMPSKIQQKNGRRKDPTTPPNRSNFLLQTRLFELIKERYPSEKLLDQHFILLRCTPLPNPQCLIEDITSPLKTGSVTAICILRGKVCSVGAKMLEACSFELNETTTHQSIACVPPGSTLGVSLQSAALADAR